MRKKLLTLSFLVVYFLIAEDASEHTARSKTANMPSNANTLRPKAKRKTVVWTRWRVGRVSVISIRLDSLTIVPTQTKQRKTQKQIRQWFEKQASNRFIASTPGPYFDTLVPERLVGWNVLPRCSSRRIHDKERVILVIPQVRKAGKPRFVATWQEVQKLGTTVWAIEMGPSIWPKIQGEVSEACTRTRATWRYALAFRGRNELLILYDSKGSLVSMANVCRRLKVREAALLDGGSSIRYGSYYNLAFVANGRLH